MTVTGITGAGWSCVPPSIVGPGVMHCTYSGSGTLATNASIMSTMVVHYTTTGTGPFTNCATVGIPSSIGTDQNPSNDTACATVTPNNSGNTVDVGINKTGGTTPVQLPYYVFDMTVTNNGIALSGSGNITVTDTVPANMTFNSIGGPGWTCTPPSGGPGTVINCTYPVNGVPAGQVLPVIHVNATAGGPAPYPPFTNCASVTVAGDTVPGNNNSCVTVTKPAGLPPITKLECKSPLVPNAAGTDCICRTGLTLRSGKCLPQVVCRAPARLNKTETGCFCPDEMVLKGNGCEPKPRRIQPTDVIRVLPGVIPGLGGGGRGGGGGGRDDKR